MSIEDSPAREAESSWFKSSYSGGAGGECVEVAVRPGMVRVRDSKDRTGPVLSFTADEWTAFVEFAARA